MPDPALPAEAADLLELWFEDACTSPEACDRRSGTWFRSDAAFDEALRRFADLPDRAAAGALDAWRSTPRGALARVMVLDQLPRNLHRGTARAFAYDAPALDAARAAIEAGEDARLHPVECTFLFLPFEHSESRADQDRCISLFDALVARTPETWREAIRGFATYATSHRDVIHRFGRFPHRNAILGRKTTPEEHQYLREGGGF